MFKPKWIIGIDEVGRGPLAGPVGVGVVLLASDFDWDLLPGVGDSKKLTVKNREAIFHRTKELQITKKLHYKVSMVSAAMIDQIGIVPAINTAMAMALNEISSINELNLAEAVVKLDGGLKAPKEYTYQETIIKGDDKELVIGLASIMAKVTRDAYMEKLAQKANFSAYNFAKHKGYDTKSHRQAIRDFGLSEEHRRSFCRNVLSN